MTFTEALRLALARAMFKRELQRRPSPSHFQMFTHACVPPRVGLVAFSLLDLWTALWTELAKLALSN
jgi:hypothetical protein